MGNEIESWNNSFKNIFQTDSWQSMMKSVNEAKQAFDNAISPLREVVIHLPSYEELSRYVENNAKLGWTLTGDMNLRDYATSELIGMSNEEIDNYFMEYYSNEYIYRELKESILLKVELRWRSIMTEVFEAYEEGKYRLYIPLLISVIEGEIADLINTPSYGGTLKDELQKAINEVPDSITKIAFLSLQVAFSKNLYVQDKFVNERGNKINRHRVQHGRDNPDLWKKEDAVRLLNLISTIQLVKKSLRNQRRINNK